MWGRGLWSHFEGDAKSRLNSIGYLRQFVVNSSDNLKNRKKNHLWEIIPLQKWYPCGKQSHMSGKQNCGRSDGKLCSKQRTFLKIFDESPLARVIMNVLWGDERIFVGWTWKPLASLPWMEYSKPFWVKKGNQAGDIYAFPWFLSTFEALHVNSSVWILWPSERCPNLVIWLSSFSVVLIANLLWSFVSHPSLPLLPDSRDRLFIPFESGPPAGKALSSPTVL